MSLIQFIPPQRKGTPKQTLSDLHLEINQQYISFEIPVAGQIRDIGRLTDADGYQAFLHTAKANDSNASFSFWAIHESFETGLEEATQMGQDPSFDGKLILLHRRRHDFVVRREGHFINRPSPSASACAFADRHHPRRDALASHARRSERYRTGQDPRLPHDQVLDR